MSDSLYRYRALLTELLFEREAAGGELSEEEESHYVERLDAIWYSLQPAEQELIDEELAQPQPTATSTEFSFVDCVVDEGSSQMPRRAA